LAGSRSGTFATTVTRPALFADYLSEQLALLADDYEIEVEVGPSNAGNPLPLRDRRQLRAWRGQPAGSRPHFPTTELAAIGDELADGIDVADIPDQRSRWRCSTACAPISAWRGWRTIPAPGRARPALHPVHQLSPLCR
jgi:hypothetical protein